MVDSCLYNGCGNIDPPCMTTPAARTPGKFAVIFSTTVGFEGFGVSGVGIGVRVVVEAGGDVGVVGAEVEKCLLLESLTDSAVQLKLRRGETGGDCLALLLLQLPLSRRWR